MQNLREKHSTEIYLRALRFTRTRFRAYPATQAEADRFLQLRRELQTSHDDLLDAEEEVSAQRSLLRYLDASLNQAVIAFSLALLSHVKNKRTDPLYLKAFPQAPSKKLSSSATSEQTKMIRRLVGVLSSEPDLASFASHKDAIQVAQAEIEKALEVLEALSAVAVKAKEALEVCKASIRDVYSSTYLRLKADKSLSVPLLESCFPSFKSASKKPASA